MTERVSLRYAHKKIGPCGCTGRVKRFLPRFFSKKRETPRNIHPSSTASSTGTPWRSRAVRMAWARPGAGALFSMQRVMTPWRVDASMGHYDAGFTLRTYTHATRQMQDQAAETMGNFMIQMM